MKFKYTFDDKCFKTYYEGQNIMAYKNKIIKNNNKKIHGPIYNIINDIIIALLGFLIFIFLNPNELLIRIFIIIVVTELSLSIFMLINYYRNYKIWKKTNTGTLSIDKYGVKDIKKDKEDIIIYWNKILLMYSLKYSCVLVTNDNLFILLDIKYKDKLKDAIKKYNNELLILEKR